MARVEIIKFPNQPARRKVRGEPTEGCELWGWYTQIDTPRPESFDPNTQQATSAYQITDNGWERVWTITTMSAEKIAEKAQQDYLNNLDWESFGEQLINYSDPNFAFSQLTAWSRTIPAFTDAKLNVEGALSNADHDKLYAAMSNLKQLAISPNTFTEAQIAEIENCLKTLGCDWTWASL